MKVLYDLIKELDPKELWDSLNLTTLYLTHERVDAFLAVHRKVMRTQTDYIPMVLERVDVTQPGNQTVFFALKRDLFTPSEGIEVTASNLEKILSLHIPTKLYDVCQTTVINELFRCLIAEEMKKPKYRRKWLRRQLTDGIDHSYKEWEERCDRNRLELEEAKKIYKDQDTHKSIQEECREILPEMGRRLSWNALVDEAIFTESFCKALLPSNPPSPSLLYAARDMIRKQMKEGPDPFEDEYMHNYFDERGMLRRPVRLLTYETGTIIAARNHIPGMSIPIVYKIDTKGIRREIQPGDLLNSGKYDIVVQDQRLENNRSLLIGYLLLYLVYPLRMHRVMKTYQVQEMAYLLSQREKGGGKSAM